jgi:hypothetical protein
VSPESGAGSQPAPDRLKAGSRRAISNPVGVKNGSFCLNIRTLVPFPELARQFDFGIVSNSAPQGVLGPVLRQKWCGRDRFRGAELRLLAASPSHVPDRFLTQWRSTATNLGKQAPCRSMRPCAGRPTPALLTGFPLPCKCRIDRRFRTWRLARSCFWTTLPT